MAQIFNATKAKSNFGEVIMASIKEPVFIEKNGRKVSVVISYEDYQHFKSLEDLQDYKQALKAHEKHKKQRNKGISLEEVFKHLD